jgi:anti-sigma factor RsiW
MKTEANILYSCEWEPALLIALEQQNLPEDLSRHMASCPACTDTAAVWSYLHGAVQDSIDTDPLPAAGLIWWRAQLAERRKLAKRSVASIQIVQNVAIVLATILAITLLAVYAQTLTQIPTLLLAGIAAFLLFSIPVAGLLYFWARSER